MSKLESLIPGKHYTRRQWGAPWLSGGARRPRREVEGMTIHHTTGDTLGNPNTVAWVLNIYRFHTGPQRGWADIGYAYLVDRYGNVFTGRGRFRQLAHSPGYNRSRLGVAYLGTGRAGHVTPEAKRAFVGLRHWLREGGGMRNMDGLDGHRDLKLTSCPGDALYEWAVRQGMPLENDPTENEENEMKRLIHIDSRGGTAYELVDHPCKPGEYALRPVPSAAAAEAITRDKDWDHNTVVMPKSDAAKLSVLR